MNISCQACGAEVFLLKDARKVRTCACPEDTAVVVSLTAVLTGDAAVASDPKPEPEAP